MNTVEEIAQIRHAYYNEGKKIRAIAREQQRSRKTIRKALMSAGPRAYELKRQKAAPVLDAWKDKIDALLIESEGMPRKQRYTAKKIYDLLQAAGYGGCISTVRSYVALKRQRPRGKRLQDVYLPLAFDPGQDGQVDWGEAWVKLAGEVVKVQVFEMRLCYSRASFVCAYPTQRQEALLDGHVRALRFFGGVPQTLTYDNMATVVAMSATTRREQQAFTQFRSVYLFKSRFCTPGEGHEKGQIESAVGFTRRNFMVPMLEAASFEALNEQLLQACLRDQQRTVSGQTQTIFEALQQERQHLRPLPTHEPLCCVTREVAVNSYSQVTFETNRYSLPVKDVQQLKTRVVTLRAFPFHIEMLRADDARVIARHARCYERDQDLCEPQHYLPLLLQRPGAFEHAKPMRQWRSTWPAAYETLYRRLRDDLPDGTGVREFLRILALHETHAAADIEQAIKTALACGRANFDSVRLCLHQLQHPNQSTQPDWPLLVSVQQPHLPTLEWTGIRATDLQRYDQLLTSPNRVSSSLPSLRVGGVQ